MDVMNVVSGLITPIVSIFFILLKGWDDYRRSKREDGTDSRLSLQNWLLFFAGMVLIFAFFSVAGFFAKQYEIDKVKGCIKGLLVSKSGPQLKTKQEIMAKMSEFHFGVENVEEGMVDMINCEELQVEDYPVYCDKLKKEYHIELYYLSSIVTGMPK